MAHGTHQFQSTVAIRQHQAPCQCCLLWLRHFRSLSTLLLLPPHNHFSREARSARSDALEELPFFWSYPPWRATQPLAARKAEVTFLWQKGRQGSRWKQGGCKWEHASIKISFWQFSTKRRQPKGEDGGEGWDCSQPDNRKMSGKRVRTLRRLRKGDLPSPHRPIQSP